MRLWNWTKRVVTDAGGGFEPVPVDLERNPGAVVELGAHNPPGVPLYVFRVGMRSGFGGTEARLPVLRRANESPHPILKEVYFCEVAGQVLEAANVYALREKVQRVLDGIAPAHRLPLCYFRAARFDYVLPVYEEGGHLVCPVLTGPTLKGDDLAALREPVTRWLRTAGYLGDDEDPEIQVVRPSDLRLVPPAAIIRCLDDEAIWLPTVEGTSAEGPVIGLLTHTAELRVRERRGHGDDIAPPPAGADVTALLRLVGGEMVVAGRIRNPWALYAGSVRPEIWARTEELTDPTSRRLECQLEGAAQLRLPIRHTAAGEVVAALQEQDITVFLAGDDDALASSVGGYLVSAGFLRHPDDIRIEAATAPPPESLDPDTIWTGGEAPELSEAETEDQEVTQS
jgi:hypothetical protein